MTPKSRKLAIRLRDGGTFTARITKRDGSTRQMRFSIAPMSPVRFSNVDGSAIKTVQDLDKREPRMLRLDAVHQLTEVPKTPAESEALRDVQAQVAEFFY